MSWRDYIGFMKQGISPGDFLKGYLIVFLLSLCYIGDIYIKDRLYAHKALKQYLY